jgi:Trp operon repressor
MSQNIKNLSNKLLTKEMTRKQFLGHIGIGILTITGVSAALNSMTGGVNKKQSKANVKSGAGYGRTAYGA